ncbi:unnamed protein product [Aspergillus oryzae]|uniref:Unnamed protein product n=2 Tax=Aspergillus oryzae TaxID=5062 RepID=A0AAN4YDT0_ASPOZ|nr:unnamed protein product [Aspergillus oryzae]GMF93756.1 unnamed protein product [Aspergillus oryzae]GMG06277.1 unnamed protein product [Aspergillus oryzae]GMG27895.1 unnamed protein product [Aspergillus oryzae]GMG50797.1 unnamed protein product [Aspergillus oryzae var. brunneus]
MLPKSLHQVTVMSPMEDTNSMIKAFNTVSQRNNEASVQMAKSALVDNTMMKAVAIVSLVYLPGTFVSARILYPEKRWC